MGDDGSEAAFLETLKGPVPKRGFMTIVSVVRQYRVAVSASNDTGAQDRPKRHQVWKNYAPALRPLGSELQYVDYALSIVGKKEVPCVMC